MKSERDFALSVIRALQQAGHEALLAGGCVRDELLNLEPKDYDIATAALPEDVMALFRRTIAVGAAFGVVEVLGPRPYRVQVATFRRDGHYSDARRPDEVIFSTAEEDAKRRDFTINGMFLDPLSHRVIDFVGGQTDLEARILRAIGDPYERFREDRLRLLRAVRMAARFGLWLDPDTQTAIQSKASALGEGVSAERIADELRKMLLDPHRVRAMRLFIELGLAAAVMPELPATDWAQTLRVLEALASPVTFPLALAVMLRDLGRRTTNTIALRLRLSSAERERAEWLVHHRASLLESRLLRPSQLKVLLVHPGMDELLALHRAEACAEGRDQAALDHVELRRAEWLADGSLCPAPLLTGYDLIQMGMAQGPRFKLLLDQIREAQLDGQIRTPDDARMLVQRLLE